MIWAYKSTVALKPPVVLGRRLKPFTLGHAHLLMAYDSPFVVNGSGTVAELVFAVWVCSQGDYTRALADLDRGRAAKDAKELGRRSDRFNTAEEIRIVQGYVRAYCEKPPRWEDPRESALRVPWPFLISTALRRYLHMTEAQAWNTPVNKALCEFAAIGALMGDQTLMTEKEVVLMAAMQEQEATSGG